MAKSIKSVLKKRNTYTVNGSLWMECNGMKFFGPGPVELLELIEKTGSISQAAKKMKMSYKKAWEIINMLNEKTSVPLVDISHGGKEGGGSSISAEAKEMIKLYRSMRTKFAKFLEQESNELK